MDKNIGAATHNIKEGHADFICEQSTFFHDWMRKHFNNGMMCFWNNCDLTRSDDHIFYDNKEICIFVENFSVIWLFNYFTVVAFHVFVFLVEKEMVLLVFQVSRLVIRIIAVALRHEWIFGRIYQAFSLQRQADYHLL